MPTFTGRVTCVQISDSTGFTTVEDSAGDSETFVLYSGNIPPTVTSFTRIQHSMWLSMLRDAMANGLQVRVIHPSGSAAVTTLRLDG